MSSAKVFLRGDEEAISNFFPLLHGLLSLNPLFLSLSHVFSRSLTFSLSLSRFLSLSHLLLLDASKFNFSVA